MTHLGGGYTCTKCGMYHRTSVICMCDGETQTQDWDSLKIIIFRELEKKYGKLSFVNYSMFSEETEKLKKIWRKNKDKFNKKLIETFNQNK